jgi:demethylmenaquinone methyltransferase/2-methoxy-6-polyprenyl-1,4-benzoquinol methylase
MKATYKDNKREFVYQMFNRIAEDYDFLNQIISFGFNKKIKEKVVKRVPLEPGSNILDVCTGTGDIAIYLARTPNKDYKVTGLDFSENMLKIAQKKAAGFDNINFVQGDALNLPFEDESFDACFVGYGLRNLENLRKGILEMKRVTKKGGYVVSLDTGKPKGLINTMFRLYFDNFVPYFGKIFHGDSVPYKYLPDSSKYYPPQDELIGIFKELGFSEVKNFNYFLGAIAQQVAKV